MTFLYNEKRFSDLIIFCWTNIEINFTEAVAAEFGIHYSDERADFIGEKLEFETKKEFLSMRGLWRNDVILLDHEREAIDQFQSFRNKIFHDIRATPFGYSPEVQKNLMLLAIEAKNASDKLRISIVAKNRPPYNQEADLKNRASFKAKYLAWKPQAETEKKLIEMSR